MHGVAFISLYEKLSWNNKDESVSLIDEKQKKYPHETFKISYSYYPFGSNK